VLRGVAGGWADLGVDGDCHTGYSRISSTVFTLDEHHTPNTYIHIHDTQTYERPILILKCSAMVIKIDGSDNFWKIVFLRNEGRLLYKKKCGH